MFQRSQQIGLFVCRPPFFTTVRILLNELTTVVGTRFLDGVSNLCQQVYTKNKMCMCTPIIKCTSPVQSQTRPVVSCGQPPTRFLFAVHPPHPSVPLFPEISNQFITLSENCQTTTDLNHCLRYNYLVRPRNFKVDLLHKCLNKPHRSRDFFKTLSIILIGCLTGLIAHRWSTSPILRALPTF